MIYDIKKIEEIEKRDWQLLSLMCVLLILLSIFSIMTVFNFTSALPQPIGEIYFYSFLILSLLLISYVTQTRIMLNKFRKKIIDDDTMIDLIKENAMKETLISLVTKEHFEDCLAMQFKRSQASSTPFSVVVVKITNLVFIDSTFGYKVGNEIICRMTKIFRELIAGQNSIFRYSTEIFTSILASTNEKELQRLIIEMEQELSGITLPDGKPLKSEVSGVTYPHDTLSLHDLRKRAFGSFMSENID